MEGAKMDQLITPNRGEYLVKTGANESLEIEGCQVYSFALPFGHAFGIHPSSMGDFTLDRKTQYPEYLRLWLLFSTAIEDLSMGTPSFKEGNLERLARLCYHHAESGAGLLNRKDKAFYVSRLSHSPWFRPEVAEAYETAQKLLGDSKHLRTHQPQRPLRQQFEDDNDPLDGICAFWTEQFYDVPDYDVQAEAASFFPSETREALIQSRAEDDDDVSPRMRIPEAVEVDDDEAEAEERRGAGRGKPKPWASINIPRMDDRFLTPKCQVVYVPIPAEDDPNRLVGYLVHVVQLDPHWNPGSGIQKIVDCRTVDEQEVAFSQLTPYRSRGHPVFGSDRETLARDIERLSGRDAGNSHRLTQTTGHFETHAAEVTNAILHGNMLSQWSHPYHPCKWATASAACTILRQLGGCKDLLHPRGWTDRSGGLRKPMGAVSYTWPLMYHSQAGTTHAGIFQSVWPHEEQFLCQRGNQEEEDPLDLNRGLQRQSVSTRKADLYQQVVRDGADYQTTDMLQHFHYHAMARIRSRSVQLPIDPELEVVAYQEYAEALEAEHRVGHHSLFMAIQPRRSITSAMSSIVDFAAKLRGQPISIRMEIYDPKMDTWGNMMIKDLLLYRMCFGVEDCIVSHYTQLGTASTDFFSKGASLPRLILSGGPGEGKTYPLLIVCKKTTIEGTTREEHYSSTHADTVGHDVDVILLCDEGQIVMEKDGTRTQISKVLLDSGRVVVVRATIKKKVDNTTELVREETISIHSKSIFVASNYYPWQLDSAVADRFMCMTKTSNNTTTIAMDVKGDSIKAATIFQVRQMAVAWVYKAIALGAIENIDLSVYNLVLDRMIGYLEREGTGTHGDKSASRTYRKVLTALRHFVVVNAVNQVINVPGGALYQDPDWYEKIPEKVSPLLYPTKQLFLWSVLMMRDMWIKTDSGRILQATVQLANVPVSIEGEHGHPTVEDYARHAHEQHNGINWKVDEYDSTGDIVHKHAGFGLFASRFNPHQQQAQGPPVKKYDLNYVEVSGGDNLFERIRSRLPPGSGFQTCFVEKTIKSLARATFHPRGGRLLPVPVTELADLCESGDSFPRLDDDTDMPIVRLEGDKIFIATESLHRFDHDLLIEAFQWALVSGHFRPQRFILPIPLPKQRHLMRTLDMSQEDINAMVEAMVMMDDQDDADADAEVQFDDPNKPLSRRDGISFPILTHCTPSMLTVLSGGKSKLDDTDEEWRARRNHFRRQRGAQFLHIQGQDIDDWCAQQRHYQCGLPLDEEPRTYNSVFADHQAFLETTGERPLRYRYPTSFMSQSGRAVSSTQMYGDMHSFRESIRTRKRPRTRATPENSRATTRRRVEQDALSECGE